MVVTYLPVPDSPRDLFFVKDLKEFSDSIENLNNEAGEN